MAMPSARAPTPKRACDRMIWALRKPSPLAPINASSGTSQLSKISSLVIMPSSVWMSRDTFRPGLDLSTANMEMPPCWRFSWSVTATTKITSAGPTLEMKTLVPLITHLSPRLTALVWIALPGSAPPEGSVCANAYRSRSSRQGSR
ncbi:hypothetical protein D3C81_749050 [compost metagenome]